MRIVLDTNVWVSGLFWSGSPSVIVQAWKAEKLDIVLSPAIFEEYRRISDALIRKYPQIVDLQDTIELLVTHSEYCTPDPLPHAVSCDPDDDKFIACAIAAKVDCIVSGDRDLLDVDCYQGIKIISPANFVKFHLKNSEISS